MQASGSAVNHFKRRNYFQSSRSICVSKVGMLITNLVFSVKGDMDIYSLGKALLNWLRLHSSRTLF